VLELDDLVKADDKGDTPLHSAAFRGNRECLLLLLQYGAAPDAVNAKGLSPLDLARKKGHTACVRTLQEYHLHHSTDSNFDSVLFLHAVEVSIRLGTPPDLCSEPGSELCSSRRQGHQLVKQTAGGAASLTAKASIRLEHVGGWLAYNYQEGHTFW
jgi:hypothetical protein